MKVAVPAYVAPLPWFCKSTLGKWPATLSSHENATKQKSRRQGSPREACPDGGFVSSCRLEGHAKQCLKNSRVTESSRTRLSDGSEARHIERAVGIASQGG